MQNPEERNENPQKSSLGLHFAFVLITAATLHAQEGSPITRLTTEDGTRFLLLPTGGPPVVHWVTVTPAGILEDPVGLPGLSHAAALASLEGTDRIGSTDTSRESVLFEEIDRLEAAVTALEHRGEGPDGELERRLSEARESVAGLSDPAAWWRLLLAAPATDAQFQLQHDGTVLSLTTTTMGVGAVAALLYERREHSVLRGVHAELRRIQDRAAALRANTPLAELRAEALALAFSGHPYGRLWARPGPPVELTRDVALRVWRQTQRPDRGLHVLVGGFTIEEVRPVLERVFRVTELADDPGPTQHPILRGSSTRRASVPGGSTAAMVVGLSLPRDPDRNTLEAVRRWIAGGADSFLHQGLRSRGYVDFRVDSLAPFPSPGNTDFALLLIEVELGAADPAAADHGALRDQVRALLAAALEKGPLQVELDPIITEMESRYTTARGAGNSIAHQLAVQCGLLGREPEDVLGPFKAPSRSDCMALLSSLGQGNRIEVEWEPGH